MRGADSSRVNSRMNSKVRCQGGKKQKPISGALSGRYNFPPSIAQGQKRPSSTPSPFQTGGIFIYQTSWRRNGSSGSRQSREKIEGDASVKKLVCLRHSGLALPPRGANVFIYQEASLSPFVTPPLHLQAPQTAMRGRKNSRFLFPVYCTRLHAKIAQESLVIRFDLRCTLKGQDLAENI